MKSAFNTDRVTGQLDVAISGLAEHTLWASDNSQTFGVDIIIS
jgi:hypothetical protein